MLCVSAPYTWLVSVTEGSEGGSDGKKGQPTISPESARFQKLHEYAIQHMQEVCLGEMCNYSLFNSRSRTHLLL